MGDEGEEGPGITKMNFLVRRRRVILRKERASEGGRRGVPKADNPRQHEMQIFPAQSNATAPAFRLVSIKFARVNIH